MASGQQIEELIASLGNTVQDALAYFEGPGSTSQVRVGDWSPWDGAPARAAPKRKDATGNKS